MSGSRVVRIFSDLHYRDGRSEVHDLAALGPLLAGADEVVLNGDTLDTQIPALRGHTEEVRAFFAAAGPVVTFLSGNHDPDISELAELELAGGRIWVTHGDVLFDLIAPWSHLRGEFRRRLEALGAGLGAGERARVETRLRLNRLACHDLPETLDLSSRSPGMRLRWLLRTFGSPASVGLMVRAWREAPGRAAALARAQRPGARVVVLGHTHFPGVWRVPGKAGEAEIVVINTGTFARPFGGSFVEVAGGRVRVVRIVRRGGFFEPGRVVAEF
ncbi:MAG: metallophosphoesterase family protein [Verrucomicrobia bacterium]|nr:metallophosphoesterase family protein [Verrucomicrobiota bacterium]